MYPINTPPQASQTPKTQILLDELTKALHQTREDTLGLASRLELVLLPPEPEKSLNKLDPTSIQSNLCSRLENAIDEISIIRNIVNDLKRRLEI